MTFSRFAFLSFLNMRTLLVPLFLCLLLPGMLWARDVREDRRIEHLLRAVESLDGAAFIRNGTEHGPKDAGSHLRMKLKRAGDRVKTAEDFIKGCASRSTLTGTTYKIRMPDGRVIEAGSFFQGKLRSFDATGD